MTRNDVRACTLMMEDFDVASKLQMCKMILQALPENKVAEFVDQFVRSTITGPCSVTAGISDSEEAASAINQLNAVCDQDCGDNGKCRQGACVCDEGYGGKFCLIDLSVPPQIVRVGNGGNCDPKVSDGCDHPIVTAEKMSLDHVKCRIQKAQFGSNGQYTAVGEVSEVEARKVSVDRVGAYQFVVMCPLPEASTHIIQLGHEGYNFSVGRLYPVLDMNCYTCISILVCTPKPLLCVVDGECYKDGAHAPDDECMICDFRRSKTSLSPKITPECYGPQPQSADLSVHDIVILSVTLVGLLLAIVATAVILYWRRQRKTFSDCGKSGEFEFSEEPDTKEWKG